MLARFDNNPVGVGYQKIGYAGAHEEAQADKEHFGGECRQPYRYIERKHTMMNEMRTVLQITL
ncbi:hypothetical protein GCM10028806_43620 [Spirosoma terrae]